MEAHHPHIFRCHFCPFNRRNCSGRGIQQTEERELRKRLMNTARTVAEMNEVKQALDDQTKERSRLQHAIEEIRIIQDADYIVVMDMDHMRLTHPVKTRIGQRSEGQMKNLPLQSISISQKHRESLAQPLEPLSSKG